MRQQITSYQIHYDMSTLFFKNLKKNLKGMKIAIFRTFHALIFLFLPIYMISILFRCLHHDLIKLRILLLKPDRDTGFIQKAV